jgi:hypothetical protein
LALFALDAALQLRYSLPQGFAIASAFFKVETRLHLLGFKASEQINDTANQAGKHRAAEQKEDAVLRHRITFNTLSIVC